MGCVTLEGSDSRARFAVCLELTLGELAARSVGDVACRASRITPPLSSSTICGSSSSRSGRWLGEAVRRIRRVLAPARRGSYDGHQVPRPPLRSQRLPIDGLWGNWRERADVLVLARPVSRGLLAAAAAAALVVGLAPLAFLIASGFVVGDLRAGATGGWHSPGGHRLIGALGVAAGIFVVWQVAAPVQGTIGRLVTRWVDGAMRRRLLTAGVAGPSVAALEDADLAAHLSEASRQVEHNPNTPGMALAGLFMLSGTYVQVAGTAVVVALAFSPWAAAVLLAGAWAWRYGHRSALVRLEAAHGVSEPQRRMASYFRRVGLDPASGKETRLFALAPWIRDRRSHRFSVAFGWFVDWSRVDATNSTAGDTLQDAGFLRRVYFVRVGLSNSLGQPGRIGATFWSR
jgi:hypothetical protein